MRSVDQCKALTNGKHEIILTGQRCVNYFIRCKYYNLIKINIINLTVTLENKIKKFKKNLMEYVPLCSMSVRENVRKRKGSELSRRGLVGCTDESLNKPT